MWVDIAYGGIWIVIGIASTALGIGVTMSTPGVAAAMPAQVRSSVGTPQRIQDAPRQADHAQQVARFRSLSNGLRRPSADLAAYAPDGDAAASFVQVEATRRWHVIDVLMPGEIRAAVSVMEPVREIRAFG